ncbi:dihydrofolate reductase [Porticoccus sp.]|uniref:dihydrofolate reductase n=1 Tax=Porticoccus sp. TaxID=2024853 RepID=UPI003F6A0B38
MVCLTLSLIVAMDRNRVIGKNNTLPWRLPDDLKYFKSVTMGKPILMGRKTFESIGRPLPGRLNIVISRDPCWQHADVVSATSLADAIALAAVDPGAVAAGEVMVIGGEQVYRCAIDLADRLYITRVDTVVEGDAFFPAFDETRWCEVARKQPENRADIPYYFQVLERRRR